MPRKTLKPDRPNEAKDAPPEWQEAIKNRSLEQEVSEDDVVKYGLYYEFKVQKEIDEIREAQKAVRDGIKESNELLKELIKEMKKKK